jgi:alkylated DNA repair dioxygenase AlkB
MYNIIKDGKDVEPLPRLVIAQTEKNHQRVPIYRMPGCNQKNIPVTSWTNTVNDICKKASDEIHQNLNHCVITLFRDENDSLAFHQDKLLDLDENSVIISISFGSPRPFIFQSLYGKQKQQIILQPGSILAIGPNTNKTFSHAIPKLQMKSGPRISISARTVKTFLVNDDTIVGKGDEFQDKNYPMIENHSDETKYTPEMNEKIKFYNNKCDGDLLNLRNIINEK